MSSIINALLVVGGLLGVVIVFQNRCSWLGLCGDSLFPSASATTPTTTTTPVVTSGGVDETASNLDANGNWNGNTSAGCCVCEMQGDRIKCQRHGNGVWFNPPAGEDGSNDQSVELSLKECNKGCGSNITSETDRDKGKIEAVVCPSGYASVNGKCQKISGKGGNTSGGSKSSPAPAPKKSSVTGSGQKIKPQTGSGYDTYFNANPGGYKPGGGTYFAHAYYNTIKRIQYNSCSYLTLNGKRLSI